MVYTFSFKIVIAATDLERLYDDLLDRYRSVNPVNYTNPVTNIDLGFQLLQVEGLVRLSLSTWYGRSDYNMFDFVQNTINTT